MKERLLDIFKWGIVIIIIAIAFYIVAPTYFFMSFGNSDRYVYKCNKITGKIEVQDFTIVLRGLIHQREEAEKADLLSGFPDQPKK